MADQDKRNWIQKHFYGGYSNDKLMGIANSFRYGKAIEIRKNPNSIVLAHAVEAETISLTNVIKAMVTIQSTGDKIAFCADGKIFRQAYGATTWVNCYTDATNRSILNGYEYNSYLYWFTSGHVHRIAVANIDASWAGDVAENYKAFLNSNANAHPARESANKLYVGDGPHLAELDSLGTWTNNKLPIFGDEEIRSVTTDGSWIILYTRRSDKIDHGAKYFWNGTSEAWQERKTVNKMIHCAIEGDDGDYMIAGKKPHLYLSKGLTFAKLKRLPLITGTQSCIIAPNAIAYTEDDLLAFAPSESGTSSIGRGVWTYGKEDNNYPNSLNFDYPTVNDNTTDEVHCVHLSNGELYFSWKNGTSYGLNKVNRAKYAATGSIHSRVFYGELSSREKAAMAVSLGFNKLAAGQKIQAFLRKNLATSWPETAEITVDQSVEADQDIYIKEVDDALDVGDFTFLESKLVLTAGTSQATTPEVTELAITFDPVLEKSDD